jgi:hypothetical protein
MEFVLTYLLPIILLVADFVIGKNPKWKSNSIVELVYEAVKEIIEYFIAKHKEEKESEK